MSLSQKHTGKVFVPWFNTAEWKGVYNLLCLYPNDKYSEVLNVLKIWKCRTPLLSAGVEGTLIILEALLTDKDTVLENQMEQIYAISIMRFLNLCATNNEKQGTFYKTAEKNDLPKWLINIRHDIAHGHKLPSLSILKMGLCQCLDWIKIKYWKVQNQIISDYIVTETPEESCSSKICEIFETYIELNLKPNINISEFEDVINEVNIIMSKTNTLSITDLSSCMRTLEEFLNTYVSIYMSETDKERLSKVLVDKALLSTVPEETTEETRIPKDFRDVCSKPLNILVENNFASIVLSQLVDVTNNLEFGNSIRKTAALWINELLLGLQKVKFVREQIDKIEERNGTSQANKEVLNKIMSELEEKCPQYKDCLDFHTMDIPSFTGFGALQDKILRAPNTFTLYFLENALKCNENSENYISDAINMVKKMVLSDDPEIDEAIYTLDNLEYGSTDNSITRSDSEKTVVEMRSNKTESQATRWRVVQDKYLYKSCPLGILPHQNRNKNPLLIF